MENKEQIQQLLESIEKSEKRRESYARLQLIFSGAAAVLLLVFVLLLGNIVPELKELLGRTDVLLTNLQTVSQELAGMDLNAIIGKMDSLIGNVDSLVTSSQTGVSEALKAIEGIDLESLNKAIKDFSEVVEPLARFFNVFN